MRALGESFLKESGGGADNIGREDSPHTIWRIRPPTLAMSSGKIVLLAAVAAVAWLLWARDRVSNDAKAHMSAITEGLDREFASRYLCIKEGPFPHDTGGRRLPCRRCEDLASAGLLERTQAPGSTDEKPRWIYNLTPKANGIYTTEQDPASGDKSPRFCFGRTRVHHLAAAQPGMLFGGNYVIGVEYVIEAIDPHPLVFARDGAALGLPKPVGDNPKLFAPQVTTVVLLTNWQYLESDPTFRYGSWLIR